MRKLVIANRGAGGIGKSASIKYFSIYQKSKEDCRDYTISLVLLNIINYMDEIIVSTDKMNPIDAYVCWLDIMGTKNSMSESFEKSANFILRFHSAILNAKKRR